MVIFAIEIQKLCAEMGFGGIPDVLGFRKQTLRASLLQVLLFALKGSPGKADAGFVLGSVWTIQSRAVWTYRCCKLDGAPGVAASIAIPAWNMSTKTTRGH